MARIDQIFSKTHSLLVRYIIDDSSSLVPYFGTPPGIYVPGFPVHEQDRNQYFTVQDRKNLGHKLFNELRFGVNRTTASSIVAEHPGVSVSLLPFQPFGMLDIAGLSLLGNSPVLPLGVFSTTYQVQDQISRTTNHQTLKFGGEFRRINVNGPVNFPVDGLSRLSKLGFGIVKKKRPSI